MTDGSNLYPRVLAALWPDAEHQLCVFHIIKDLNELVLKAVRRLRKAMGRRGQAGRKSDLTRMREYLPELATLRRFADRVYWLFDTPKDVHQACCRRAARVRDPTFQAVKELVQAMEQLAEPKFRKIMAYLKNPISRRVRTNNHVERANRMIRFLEKVRYQWRRRKMFCARFLNSLISCLLRLGSSSQPASR